MDCPGGAHTFVKVHLFVKIDLKFPLVKDLLVNINNFCFVKVVVTAPLLDSDHSVTVQERRRVTKWRFQQS